MTNRKTEFEYESKRNYRLNECPCKNETPESIKIRAYTDTLIITVHGTNAKHAKWTYDGKLVNYLTNETLKNEENFNYQIARFCWSGGNSHSKRLNAGKELADYIQNLSKNYPEIKFILVGHSHGGNVIMYALNKLRKTNNANEIKKVVTLATPFLYVKLKKLNPITIYGTFLLTLICIVDLNLLKPELQPNYFAIIMIAIFTLWQVLALSSIVSQKNRLKRFGQYVLLLIGKNSDVSMLENEIADLDITQPDLDSQPKYLIIRPVGDEASMALTVSQFLSWANIFTLKLFSSISDKYINYFIRTTKEYFFRLGSIFGLGPSYEISDKMSYEEQDKVLSSYFDRMSYKEFLIAIMTFILTAIPIIFLLYWLFPNLGKYIKDVGGPNVLKELIGLLLIGWFILLILATFILAGAILCFLGIISALSLFFLTLSALPFGLDAIFWSHFTQTTVESTPPGLFDVYVHPSVNENYVDKELDLAHSLIYNEDEVIIKIKSWLLKD